jgi:hypothetical protein
MPFMLLSEPPGTIAARAIGPSTATPTATPTNFNKPILSPNCNISLKYQELHSFMRVNVVFNMFY